MKQYHKCGHHLDWYGCYDKDAKYNKFIMPESFAHPAKMSWGLLEHIFKHLQELNLITPDTTVVDFMAGTFRTGIMAELFGYKSIGIELEPHFIKMIADNKTKVEKITGRKSQMQFIQGDARQLSGLLTEKGYCGVISPPYAESTHKINQNYWQRPDVRTILNKKYGGSKRCISPNSSQNHDYGNNPSNIGNLKDTPLVGITSPPYVDQNIENRRFGGLKDLDRTHMEQRNNSTPIPMAYSEDSNNIGNLPDRQLVGITSPPYESSTLTQDKEFIKKIENQHRNGSRFQGGNDEGYGNNKDNLGNQNGNTYLEAMLQVYSQSFKSGISPLVLVTKNPTRNGKLRDLAGDTVSILQQAGYEIFDYHRAILFKEVTQGMLDGESFTKPKGRLSFFKRLSYDKGNVVARWEDVIFARIPDEQGCLTGITSPPYAETLNGCGTESIKKRIAEGKYKGKRPDVWTSPTNIAGSTYGNNYSKNPANIGNLLDRPKQILNTDQTKIRGDFNV